MSAVQSAKSNPQAVKASKEVIADIHPLQDVGMNIVRFLLVITGIGVAVVSILAKASLLNIFLRTAGALLIVGFVGWLFNFFLGKFIVASTVEEMNEEIQKEYDSKKQEFTEISGTPEPSALKV